MDHSSTMGFWMQPLLTALATNPAYYYYYTAKADLFNESILVRRGNQRVSKKIHSSIPTHPPHALATLPLGTLGGARRNPNQILRQHGIGACPQCETQFNGTNCRPVQEACGHIKCRKCFISNDERCPQCRDAEKSRRNASVSLVGTSKRILDPPGSRIEDLDILPPLLTVEEPLCASERSCFRRGDIIPVKELPPLLSSVAADSKSPKASRKRKQWTEFSPKASIPSKIQKSANGGTPVPKVTFSRERSKPKPRRHSSTICSKKTSSRKSQYSSSKSKVSKEQKESSSPHAQLLAKPQLSLSRQENKEQKVPSFKITISPTSFKPSKFATSSPIVTSCPPSISSKVTSREDEKAISLPRSLSCSTLDGILRRGRSSEGSNSNSLETDDPLCIRDDWLDSNSTENRTQKLETKKKKKRNPVTIHDHITILSGDPPLYQCNVCMKKFKTKAHIKYHEFCQNGEKPFKCEECGQGFIAKSHYEYHLRTHTGERPYVCPKCGKGFNQRGKVTRHMRSHTGEKPFICEQCGRGFANAQALRSHFLIHTGERPFPCQYCNKRFTGMTNLKKHVITHTGERPFSCTHCGKSFGLKWTLDLHLRTHSTERPFACDQCTRAFSNSKDLRRHLVIHSGERPFKCWICGTAFRRKDNLDRHIKNTHNQPKEVAKQLANEAAAEYMASSKQSQANTLAKASASKRIGHTFMPSSLSKGCVTEGESSTSRGISKKVDKKTRKNSLSKNVDVIMTAGLSPPSSPNQIRDDACDVYVLPNGQGDILKGNLSRDLTCVEAEKVEADSQIVKINEYEGLAELRTVPVNEYHKIDGIKILDIVKSASTHASGSDSMKLVPKEPDQTTVTIAERKDVKPILDEGELYCANPEGSTKEVKAFSPQLTVTLMYENDETTHFIQEPSSYPTGEEDPMSFPEDRTNVLTIPKNMLFGFGHGDKDRSQGPLEIENNALETFPPRIKKLDVLSKKCFSSQRNLSKFQSNEGSVDSILLCRTSKNKGDKNNPIRELSYTLNSTINCNNESFEFTSYNVVSGERREEGAEGLVQEEGFENYCNDPMFQDRITDDDYQRSSTYDPLQSCKLFHENHENKESVDSILLEGMEEEHYVSHEEIFQNDIVDDATQKLEDNSKIIQQYLEDIGDKECPVSILQDDGSNFGSVDPVSGDENDDLNDDHNYFVSSKFEIQKPIQRNNIDTGECPELIIAPENESVPCKETNGFFKPNVMHESGVESYPDSDMESPPDSLVSNYRFLYAPEVTSGKSTMDSYPSSQSSFRFLYENGGNVSGNVPFGSGGRNMRIVYACAAATAQAPDGDSNAPQKLKLLYAEALGVGTRDDSGQVQLVYTSTAPNQNLVRGPNQHVHIYSPTLITTDNKTYEDNAIQMLFAQQSKLEHPSPHSVPVQVLYNGNGTVMAQTVGQPQDLSWIKRDLNQSFFPHVTSEALSLNQQEQHDKYLLPYTSNTQTCTNPASTRELGNHHNYATNPYQILDSCTQVRLTSPYETESDALRTLARAPATRMLSMHADADATTRVARAIAAAGREAQLKRKLDIIERSRNLAGTGTTLLGRKGENVPHRGPRKRYLSQLTSARK